MFKKKTFSDILEAKINKEETILSKKEETEKMIKEDKQTRVINLVYSQYKQAQKLIGERFTLKQQHDTMFWFSFRGKSKIYICKLFAMKLEPEGDFEFSDYSFSRVYNSKLKSIGYKDIKLNELAGELYRWAEIVLEEELSLMENTNENIR